MIDENTERNYLQVKSLRLQCYFMSLLYVIFLALKSNSYSNFRYTMQTINLKYLKLYRGDLIY